MTPSHARMLQVLRYIDAHLDDDLRIETLCGVAAFSKYHFHRRFSALFGVSVHRYVQILRLKRAAHRLAFRRGDSVIRIALESGYAGPEAFARVFRQRVGQTPSAFRRQPHWAGWHAVSVSIAKARSISMATPFRDDQVRLVDFPATAVAVLEHRGDPARIGDSIRQFIAWRQQAGLPPRVSATFNILHVDPETTPAAEYRIDLCAATEGAVLPNAWGVMAGCIPGGRCAVLRVTGPSEWLRPAVQFLYADWLPRSGEAIRDAPVFVQRISFFPDVAESEAVTDVFLPIAG